MGPGRFELPTSRLSGVRSHQLSYEPDHTAVSDSNTAVVPTSRLSRLNHLSTCSKSNKKCRCSCGSATLLRVREFTYSPPSSQDKNFIFFQDFFQSENRPLFFCRTPSCRPYETTPLLCFAGRHYFSHPPVSSVTANEKTKFTQNRLFVKGFFAKIYQKFYFHRNMLIRKHLHNPQKFSFSSAITLCEMGAAFFIDLQDTPSTPTHFPKMTLGRIEYSYFLLACRGPLPQPNPPFRSSLFAFINHANEHEQLHFVQNDLKNHKLFIPSTSDFLFPCF